MVLQNIWICRNRWYKSETR